jgi:hypothetical protein
VALVLGAFVCGACAPAVVDASAPRYRPPPFDAAALALPDPVGAARPADAPDVLILAFSGRCDPSVCVAPDGNSDDLARDTLPALVRAMADKGVSVSFRSYRAHVDDHALLGSGYRSAAADLIRAFEDWVVGRRDPTRLVLLGHSHGTQFVHLLAFEHPQVPFEASVLIDSVCVAWDADHARRLVEAMTPGVGDWATASAYQVGCDVLDLPQVGRRDLGDVVPWNVATSLEVQSGGQVLGLVRDATPNLRLDGSTLALDLVRFTDVRHRDVDEPSSPAFDVIVTWLTERLQER